MAILQQREMEANARQDLARPADIALRNQIAVMQAQAQTDANLRDLQAHSLQTGLPAPMIPQQPRQTSALLAQVYPSIPDTQLAASRARVIAAARNRR